MGCLWSFGRCLKGRGNPCQTNLWARWWSVTLPHARGHWTFRGGFGVAAHLLMEQGHEVIALFMRNWNDAV